MSNSNLMLFFVDKKGRVSYASRDSEEVWSGVLNTDLVGTLRLRNDTQADQLRSAIRERRRWECPGVDCKNRHELLVRVHAVFECHEDAGVLVLRTLNRYENHDSPELRTGFKTPPSCLRTRRLGELHK